MSRLRSLPGLALTAASMFWLTVAVPACEEDGRTAPATCAEPPLAIYDIQTAPEITGTGGESDTTNPCVTKVGHAIGGPAGDTTGGTAAAGTSTGGGSAGKSGTSGSGGKGGGGDPAMNDAGAGGA